MKRRVPAAPVAGDLTPRKRRRRIVESVLVAFGCIVLGDSLIGEQGWWATAVQHGGKLPAEVTGVADAGVHAEAAGRHVLMGGVAGQ